MSPAEGSARGARIVSAALALGTRSGVGALSLGAIAAEAQVSKALVLYHFGGKAALLEALATTAGQANAARLAAAARTPRAMAAWRSLLRDPALQREAALFGALHLESDVDATRTMAVREAREDAASALAVAVLADVGLVARVPAPAIGRLLLRQLDGLASAGARGALGADALEAEIDTFALSLIGLAR